MIAFSHIMIDINAEESKQQLGIVSEIINTVEEHAKSLENFCEDHSAQASTIKGKAEETFHQRYMVSEYATWRF